MFGRMSKQVTQDLPIVIFQTPVTPRAKQVKQDQIPSGVKGIHLEWLFLFSLGLWLGRILKPRASPHPFTLLQLSDNHSLVWLAQVPALELGTKCHKCNMVLLARVMGLIRECVGLHLIAEVKEDPSLVLDNMVYQCNTWSCCSHLTERSQYKNVVRTWTMNEDRAKRNRDTEIEPCSNLTRPLQTSEIQPLFL